MKSLLLFALFGACVVAALANSNDGSTSRLLLQPLPLLIREKRQFARPGVGSSASSANANAQNQFFDKTGFGGSAANAQAQGFQSQGPLGGFGASAANTQTQAFKAGQGGIQGSAGQSGSQVYNLPNGQSLNVAYTGGFAVGPDGRPTSSNANSVAFTANYGPTIEEVVVLGSSLNVRKKANVNRLRRALEPLPILLRFKRQHGRRRGGAGGGFGGGFGASAANAQAQGFQNRGPLGGFGASAANTQTQAFNVGPNGIRGSAGLSGSQAYNLPNGQTLNVAYTQGYSVGPNGRPNVSQGNSVSFSRG